jgi:hypothetical protein
MGLGVEKDKSMTTEKFILPPEAVIAYLNVLLLAELVVPTSRVDRRDRV